MSAATSITDSIDQTQQNNRWISDNMQGLREEYGGEYIAVRGSDVVAHNESGDDILGELEDIGAEFSKVTITFVHEPGHKLIR